MKKTIISIVLSALLLTTFTRNEVNSQTIGDNDLPILTIGLDESQSEEIITGASLIDFIWGNRNWTKKIKPTICDTIGNDIYGDCAFWGNWAESTAVVDGNILGYEDCKFIVSYASRVCLTDPKMMQINILGWSAKWTLWDQWWGNDCPHLKKHVESKPPFDKAKALLEIQKAFFDRISREIFIRHNQESYNQSGKYLECGSDDEVRIMYTLATCNAILSVYVDNKKGKTEVWRYPLSCVKYSCCKFTNKYCWDSKNNVIVSKTYYDGPTDDTCNGELNSNGDIYQILKNIQDNGYTIKETTITPCVPSCSEYIPSNN